jgi:hypothetical protein
MATHYQTLEKPKPFGKRNTPRIEYCDLQLLARRAAAALRCLAAGELLLLAAAAAQVLKRGAHNCNSIPFRIKTESCLFHLLPTRNSDFPLSALRPVPLNHDPILHASPPSKAAGGVKAAVLALAAN